MAEQAQVKFGADTSGLDSGSAKAVKDVDSVGSAVKGLQGLLLGLGETVTGVFAEFGNAPRVAAEQVRHTSEQVSEIKEALLGVGEAVIAAFAVEQVEEFAEKLGEAQDKIEKVSLAYGFTIGEVQRYQGIATATSTSLDVITGASRRLDVALGMAKEGGKRQQEVFKELGIDINQARTPAQLMTDTLNAFSREDASINKVQQATALFGRNIEGIAPLLNASKEQMDGYNEQVERYGLVSEAASTQGLALDAAFDENKNAATGLSNVITADLAPAFTQLVTDFNTLIGEMIDSYNNGGVMKDILDILATTFSVVGSVIEQICALVVDLWDALFGGAPKALDLLQLLNLAVKGVGEAFVLVVSVVRTAIDAIRGILEVLVLALYAVSRVVWDALTGNWGAIVDHWQESMNAIVDRTKIAAAKVVNVWADAKAQLIKIDAGGIVAKGEGERRPPAFSVGNGFGNGTPPKQKKEKEPKSRVQEWEEALREQESLSNDYFGDETAKELAYWQDKLALTTAKSKEWYEVQEKIFQLSKTLAQRNRQESLDDAKADAQKQLDAAKNTTTLILDDLKNRENAVRASASRGEITPQNEAEQLQSLLDKEIAAQEDYENRIYAIKKAELDREAQLYATDPVNLKKTQQAAEALTLQHQNTLTQITSKGSIDRQKIVEQETQDVQKKWEAALTPIAQQFNTTFQALWTRQTSFTQAMINLADQMVFSWVEAGEKWLVKWIAQQEAAKVVHAATKAEEVATDEAAASQSLFISAATAIKKLAHSAAVAAGNAYSSLAGVPLVGPVLGAAAAAATFAAVLAFGGGIASAFGGQDQVPHDGQMTELHKDEMVLSAKYANPLRDLLTSTDFGATGSAAIAAEAGADTRASYDNRSNENNFHYSPTINGGAQQEKRSVVDLLDGQASEFRRWFRRQVRDNPNMVPGT